jgi:tetratricopeptide (TPR) repeat protein
MMIMVSYTVDPAIGSTFRKLKEGEPVPSFALKDVDGNDVTFTPDDGSAKLVAFISVEKNAKSQKLLSTLNEIYEEVAAKGVKIVAVASYEDKVEDIKAFASEKKLKFPIAVDADQKVYGEWGLFVLPATAIVDGEGKLDFEYSSYDMEYKNIVGGKVKVMVGLMTAAEYEKIIHPEEEPEKTLEQKEASRLITLGKRLASKGMHQKASEKFKEAIDKDPENLTARTLYAESLGKAGKVDEAITELNAVLEKDPNMRDAKIALGIVLIEKGDYDGAVEKLTSASMLNPKPQRAYYWLGNAYEKKGDLESAVKYYRKALKKVLGE